MVPGVEDMLSGDVFGVEVGLELAASPATCGCWLSSAGEWTSSAAATKWKSFVCLHSL